MSSRYSRPLSRAFCALVVATCSAPLSAQCESFKLTAPAPEPTALVGRSVALHGQTALIGAPGTGSLVNALGAVHSFVWDGQIWSQEQVFFGDATQVGFGHSMAIEGDTAVIGSAEFSHGVGTGASVFERTGAGWVLTQKLLPPAGNQAPFIGAAVDISGDAIVVSGSIGLYIGEDRFGEAFVYNRTPSGWVSQARLLSETDDYYGSANFGHDVAIDGDTVVVAAPGDFYGGVEPSVYVFERQGQTWTQRARLIEPEMGAGLVDIDDNTIVTASGVVPPDDTFVFIKEGADWSLQAVLPVVVTGVAIEADTILLGGVGGSSESSAQVFQRSAGRWYERTPFQGRDTISGDRFGWNGLALDGTRILIGSEWDDAGPLVMAGSVFVFERGIGQSYCATSVNTTGEVAVIDTEGCSSVFENQLTLHAARLPATAGIFVYGDSARQVAFGAGTRCVGGSVFRTRVQRPVDGQLSWQVDHDATHPSGQILAGSTWYFQAWFRDGVNGLNTTDGLEITFLP